MGVQTKIDEDKKSITISVSGQFNAAMHREFRDAYKDSVEDPTAYRFTVDLSRAEYMDSSALGMLLLLNEHVNGEGNVTIANVNQAIRDILEIAKFDTMFNIT